MPDDARPRAADAPAPAADQAERRRALDPTGSFIVQAPAGSGKTELLIQRFLTLLGQVDEPESIIAITFTRKAAGEMRHRVIAALERADDPAPEPIHERTTWEAARRARERDRARAWRLGENPARLRIQTIDSLCGALVHRMPWVSRLGAPPRPEENAGHLYARAARATLELLEGSGPPGVAAALERLIRHLDNDLTHAESLLADMLGRRDQWLRHVVDPADPAAFLRATEAALAGIVEGALEELARRFPDDLLREALGHAGFAARNLRARPDRESSGPLADTLDFTGGTRAGDLPGWLGLADLFLTRQGERRRRLDVRQGFPPTREGQEAKARCLSLPLDEGLRVALGGLRNLPPLTLDETRWDILAALVTLLPWAVAQLRVVFQQEGRVDFVEIALAAGEALGAPDAPTDLAFALDCRLRHLLVDEFQDTSQSQFRLLKMLISDWQPGDGRTVFLVGDPMQSIYGFREAEVALFLGARKDGLGPVPLTPLALTVNFRSVAGIVAWVNHAVGAAFPETEDRLTGAVGYAPSAAHARDSRAGDDPPVVVHPFFSDGPDALDREAGTVVRIVEQSRAAGPDDRVAVLVRSRSHLARIVARLHQAGRKFQAVEIDELGERPVVQDLLALTRALLDPADRIAWLAILRAPWCGLTLADLDALAGGDFAATVWDLARDPARRSALTADGRVRLDRLVSILAEALPLRGRLPVRRWVEGVWLRLGGPAGLEDRTGLEDAAVYLDLLEASAGGAHLEDAPRFRQDVARLFARPDVEGDERLQLLTIHKAKGLEFDVVILPGLGRTVRAEKARLMMWMEYLDAEERSQLLLAPIRETGGASDPLYAYLARIEAARRDHESTRLLYVAATRARRRLHLLGQVRVEADAGEMKAPAARTLLGKIWKVVEAEFVRAFARREAASGEMADPSLPPSLGAPLRRLRADWTAPAFPAAMDWTPRLAAEAAEPETDDPLHPSFDWAGELQRHVGVVVHRMLQRMGPAGRREWAPDAVRAALAAEGLAGEKLAEAVARAEAALRGTVGDARGRWILAAHEDDRREYPLSGLAAGRVRRYVLDRTFVDAGVRWIVDFKTSRHEGGDLEAFLDNERERYRRQLEAYAAVMRGVDPRPIRLGLYFPMLGGWREWAYE